MSCQKERKKMKKNRTWLLFLEGQWRRDWPEEFSWKQRWYQVSSWSWHRVFCQVGSGWGWGLGLKARWYGRTQRIYSWMFSCWFGSILILSSYKGSRAYVVLLATKLQWKMKMFFNEKWFLTCLMLINKPAGADLGNTFAVFALAASEVWIPD